MDMFLAIVLFLVGAVVVAKGADIFVDASSWLSDVTGISKILIGVTIVSIATSGPELFVSIFASLQGQADMSAGNVIGSHLCNLGLGFALIAIFRPSKNSDKLYLPNSLFTLLTALVLFGFYFLGAISYIHAFILLFIYIIFTFINIRFSDSSSDQADSMLLENSSANSGDEVQNATISDTEATSERVESLPNGKKKRVRKPTNKKEVTINILKFTIGLAAIILGSKLIVDKATFLAKAMGISEMIIGLTIVAIGTSLPEIVTTIASLIKKENDLGIGNILGSCVFNNAFIIPVSAFLLGSLTFNDSVMIDLPVAITLTLIAILPTAIGKRIYRLQGVGIAAIYLSYMVYIVVSNI